MSSTAAFDEWRKSQPHTPWTVGTEGLAPRTRRITHGVKCVASTYGDHALDVAQHIVECVNAHYALLARVAELEAALRECTKVLEQPSDWGGANLAETNGGRLPLKHARAALKVKP